MADTTTAGWPCTSAMRLAGLRTPRLTSVTCPRRALAPSAPVCRGMARRRSSESRAPSTWSSSALRAPRTCLAASLASLAAMRSERPWAVSPSLASSRAPIATRISSSGSPLSSTLSVPGSARRRVSRSDANRVRIARLGAPGSSQVRPTIRALAPMLPSRNSGLEASGGSRGVASSSLLRTLLHTGVTWRIESFRATAITEVPDEEVESRWSTSSSSSRAFSSGSVSSDSTRSGVAPGRAVITRAWRWVIRGSSSRGRVSSDDKPQTTTSSRVSSSRRLR